MKEEPRDPALINAIKGAVGVRLYENPATSERVWRALMEKEEEKEG